MDDKSQILLERWREVYKKFGLATLRTQVESSVGVNNSVGQAYLAELEEKQGNDKHEDTSDAVTDLNKAMSRAKKMASWPVNISIVGMILAIFGADLYLLLVDYLGMIFS